MVNEVSQWLTEIQTLKQQLTTLGQEREQAYASAANWRRLYESESEQRRNEAAKKQRRIQALVKELETFKQAPVSNDALDTFEQTLAKVNQIQSIDELRSQLIDALNYCEHLSDALKLEKAAHEDTRQSLTTALGDTIDLLAKEQSNLSNTNQVIE